MAFQTDSRYDGRGPLPQLAPFEAGASRASGDDEVVFLSECELFETRFSVGKA